MDWMDCPKCGCPRSVHSTFQVKLCKKCANKSSTWTTPRRRTELLFGRTIAQRVGWLKTQGVKEELK